MTGIDLKKLEDWCQDAVTLLPTPGLPASLTEMRRDAIRRHSGTAALHEIAADLAEGLSHLSEKDREIVQTKLVGRHGFGFELYTDRKLKNLRAAIKRGNVKGQKEYRELLDLASDTTLSLELQEALSRLLAEFERKYGLEQN